jgi:hypothetical protein
VCIRCKRTPEELRVAFGLAKAAPMPLMWRQRPLMRMESLYALCRECAVVIRDEQGERAQEAIRQAERSGV